MTRLAACVLVAALAGTAAAETPQQKADLLFREGRALLATDARGACAKFEASIALDPTAPGTMLNLGLCHEMLGAYATSIRWFRKAQVAAAEKGMADYESAAKQHTTTLTDKVPWLELGIREPGATVTVDGLRVDPTEYGHYEIDPGVAHEIIATAPGKQRVVRSVQSPSTGTAEALAVTITFDRAAVYVDKGKMRRRIGIGLALAGGAVWGVTLWYGFDRKHAYEVDLVDSAKTDLRTYGTSMFIGGAALVAVGAVLWWSAPGKELASDGTALVPVVGGDDLGLALTGRF